MQTFLPYPDFKKSAECLDNNRLGKQRVEAWQIYQTLQKIKERNKLKKQIYILGKDNEISEKIHKLERIGWENHPIVKMWKGYEHALIVYGKIICREWINQGFKDTMFERFKKEESNYPIGKGKFPDWFGDEEFHASHRSNLLRKNPEHYSKFGWKEPDNLPYKWIR